MDKEQLVHTHSGNLFNCKEEWKLDICKKTFGPGDHCVQQSKSGAERAPGFLFPVGSGFNFAYVYTQGWAWAVRGGRGVRGG